MKSSSLSKLRRMQGQSLGFALIRCGQLWNARGIAAVNAQAGGPAMREAHTRLLPHLQAPDGIRLTELARRVGVTKQAAQQLLADLLERGVVEMALDPDDGRARRVRLTDAGVEAMLRGTGVLLDIEEQLVPALGQRDARTLHRLLRRLLTVLEEPPVP